MIKAAIKDSAFEIEQTDSSGNNEFIVNGQKLDLDIVDVGQGRMHVIKDSKSYTVEIVDLDKDKNTVTVKVNGSVYPVSIKGKLDQLLEKLGMDLVNDSVDKEVKAPMPGLVIDVLVEVGQEIKKGDSLLILEAMKMENILKSPSDGVVSALSVKKGESVEKGKILVNL